MYPELYGIGYNKANVVSRFLMDHSSPVLIIGLGNPGEEYEKTYHNAGKEVLYRLKAEMDARYGPQNGKMGKEFYFYSYGPIHLAYPLTFMNLSGIAVKNAMEWFHIKPEETIVLYDDSDLLLGEYRESGTGSAGHHGIESVFETLKNAPIRKIRIGIRDPREISGERPRRKAGDFVLKRMSAQELETLYGVAAELSRSVIEKR